jgi:hypothetical protein
MQRRWILATTMVALALLVTGVVVSAEPGAVLPPIAPMKAPAGIGVMNLPGGGWWTGMQVVNVGTGTASVQVTLYDMNSSTTFQSVAKNLAANAAYTFSPLTDADWAVPIPTGFVGSAVVSSDQPILAIVSEANNLAVGGTAAASYDGFTADETATRLMFPLVKLNSGSSQRTTTFFVQNTTSTAANVYATFRVGASTYTSMYPSVGAYKLQTINPADAGFPAGSVGSLEITSTVQLAGIYNEHQNSATIASVLAATKGFAPTAADTKLFVPMYKQNYNTSYTGLQVQNAGSSATTIYLTYTVTYGGSGSYYTNASINPGASQTFFNVSGWPTGTYGGVAVSAAQPLVAIANETKYSTGQSAVYAAFANSKAQNCAIAPLWKTRWSGASTGQQSALIVQNVGSVDATAYVTFTMTAGGVGTFAATPQPIQAGKTYVFGPGAIAGGPPSGTAAVGSAKVCSSQPLAVLVQESTLPGWATRDMLNYEAFPIAP